MSAMAQHDWATAEVLLAEAVEICSACPEARRYYAEALWHRGDAVGALEHLDAAVELTPQDATLLVRRAEMKFACNRPVEARADADAAIELDPNLAAAWLMRGRIKQQAGELADALADYHRALAADPAQNDALLAVAEIYRQLGDPQRALVSLHGAAENFAPGSEPPQVLYMTGLAYAALGRYDDAVGSYRAAAERGGPHPELAYRSAEALWLAQQPDAARAALSEALALDPQHAASRQLWERIEVAARPVAPPR